MKKNILIVLLVLGFSLFPQQESKAQVVEVVTTAIKKVLRAIDLKIQREQNKVIWLQNAQKTIENAMSKLKLKEIGDWADKQRAIYKDYFDELKKVRSLISYYQKIKDITIKQVKLMDEYKRAWHFIQQDKNFTNEEVKFMGSVYKGILDATIQNIDQMAMVINSFTTSMNDAKRLEIIAEVNDNVDGNLKDLRKFNTENALLSLQRAKSESEIKLVKKIYGIIN